MPVVTSRRSWGSLASNARGNGVRSRIIQTIANGFEPGRDRDLVRQVVVEDGDRAAIG